MRFIGLVTFCASLLSVAPACAAPAPNEAGAPAAPFELVNGVRVLVRVEVNGVAATALLDSGAHLNVLDAAFAARLGPEPRTAGPSVSGVGGASAATYIDGVTIKGAGLDLRDERVGVMDLTALSAGSVGRPVDMILGGRAFRDYVVDLDFDVRRIRFIEPGNFVPPANATRLTVERRSGLYVTRGSVESAPEGALVLDLGNSSPLILTRGFVEAQGVLSDRKVSTSLGRGLGGPSLADAFTVRRLAFGGRTFLDVPTVAMKTAEPVIELPDVVGNVGMPILSRFRMVADFGRGALYLAPRTGPEPAFLKNRSGVLGLPSGDRIRVQHVALGSPAEKAGWRVGDEIIAVDGVAVGPGFAGSEASRWSARPAGAEVRLTMADGSTRRLVLADYF